jgi:hypothetical protein
MVASQLTEPLVGLRTNNEETSEKRLDDILAGLMHFTAVPIHA